MACPISVCAILLVCMASTVKSQSQNQSLPSDLNNAAPEVNISPYTKDMIVPDVIDNVPKGLISVKYGTVNVDPGQILTPTQVKSQPSITWVADNEKFYLFCLLDPDVPSRLTPLLRSVRHWHVGNIQGNNVSSGDVLAAFIGVGPPGGSGFHRYTFLLFEQPGRIEFTENKINQTVLGRSAFSITDFAKKYNLGTPIAGNFFQAQYDNYVPDFHSYLIFSTIRDIGDRVRKTIFG